MNKNINKKESMNKSSLNDEFDELLKESSGLSGIARKNPIKINKKENSSEDDKVTMTIREDEQILTLILKLLINECDLTYEHLYNTEGRKNGYNMAYNLQRKNGIATDRFVRWLEILGKKPVSISFVDYDYETDTVINEDDIMEIKL